MKIVPILDKPAYGFIGVETQDEAGNVVDRRVIRLGGWVDGVWRDTDISGEAEHVKALCKEAWTPEVVAAFKAAFPAPPPPRSNSEIDQDALNYALIAPGSVVRALGLVMFAEINKLRAKNGDQAYTMDQFKAALLAKMR